jgi:hypothetical protein
MPAAAFDRRRKAEEDFGAPIARSPVAVGVVLVAARMQGCLCVTGKRLLKVRRPFTP